MPQCNAIRETDQGGKSADPIPLGSKAGHGDFPARAVVILTMCLTINAYALCNLFPYVGIMVKDLLGLQTTNEAGIAPNDGPRNYILARLHSRRWKEEGR